MSADANGWMPIKTVPKDGTRVLGWNAGRGVHACYIPSYMAHYKVTKVVISGGSVFRPTHWMPLPKPPVQS